MCWGLWLKSIKYSTISKFTTKGSVRLDNPLLPFDVENAQKS